MNKINLSGKIGNVSFSHEVYGEKFYKVFIATERASGTKDVLCCILPETIVGNVELGKKMKFTGEIRTRNVHCEKENRNHLEIFAFITSVEDYEKDENYVELNGFLCKEPNYRETPLGRQVTDLLIASNRMYYSKSDYIPCIAWGRNAIKSSEYEVGTNVLINGRLQSREYVKYSENGKVESKVAYELSISRIGVIKDGGK